MKARHRLCIVACICFLIALLTACGTNDGKQSVVKQFVYVADRSSNTISGFISDPKAGTLTAMAGAPFSAGSFSGSCFHPCLVVDPKNEFLFVQQYHQLQVLAIDPSTGSLAAVQGSPFTFAGIGRSLELTPDGRFVYVTVYGPDGILGWSIDRSNRTLVAIPGAPFGTDSSGTEAASIDPQGKFLYVPDSSGVRTYAIDRVSGALSPVGERQTVYFYPLRIFLHPSGKFGYLRVHDVYDEELLLSVSVDPQTGAMSGLDSDTPISDYPLSATCSSRQCVYAGPLHLTPDGKWLFVTGFPFQYSINSTTGKLAYGDILPSFRLEPMSPIPWADFAVGDNFVYVIANDGTLRAYSMDPGSGKVKLVTSASVNNMGSDPVIAATH